RELGFVLMALNIRKVVAQRAENNQKIYKKDNFYIISIEIVFFHLSKNFMSRTLFYAFDYKKATQIYACTVKQNIGRALILRAIV
ncbi:hypothetical protein MX641_03525, partial [Staphylococcus haemolyticus]|nr:hypothetical protein [Staphylococcus haemolyticus]